MEIYRERDRDLVSLAHSPDSHKDWAWARAKPGAQNSMLVSNMSGRGLALGPPSIPFQGTLASSWVTVEQAGFELTL